MKRLTAATALTHDGGSADGGGDSRCLKRLTGGELLTVRDSIFRTSKNRT